MKKQCKISRLSAKDYVNNQLLQVIIIIQTRNKKHDVRYARKATIVESINNIFEGKNRVIFKDKKQQKLILKIK